MKKTYTAEEIKNILSPIFDITPVEKAILFGSHARGNPTQLSDVDILIDSKGKIKGINFFGVLEDVSDALGVPVNLIEASQIIEGGRIQSEIAKKGIVIYEKAWETLFTGKKSLQSHSLKQEPDTWIINYPIVY